MSAEKLLKTEGTEDNDHHHDQPCHVNDLPDLTDRLKEQGIYGEYVQWRDKYHRWRRGEAVGAKGENTIESHEKSAQDFEYWYPTVKTFNFRRTISFWGAVTCCEGCLLFLWIPVVETYGIGAESKRFELTKVPNLVGGTLFLAGIYLAYFELINMDSEGIDAGHYNFLWCPWRTLERLGIHYASWLGALGYLIGALFYSVAQVSDFFSLEGLWEARLVENPLIIGGFLFFLSGICELIVNGVFTTKPDRLVWFVAVFNCFGGLTFWLSACPSIVGDAATRIGVAGTIAYLVAALLSLLMWRGEQFGGAMIPSLNNVGGSTTLRRDPATGAVNIIFGTPNSRQEDSLNPKLSWRGIVFLNIYVTICAAQWIAGASCLDHLVYDQTDSRSFWKKLNLLLSCAVNVVMVHMFLVLSSATVNMPKKGDQPYRWLVYMARLLSLLVLWNSFLTLDIQLAPADGLLPSSSNLRG
mmetsp:Transcript_115019/g.321447  ORF Transcript_115019/g.321447 Transcript_115019/m.321447 type:complete len:469 (+) Transcript_115019:185-1591(+)